MSDVADWAAGLHQAIDHYRATRGAVRLSPAHFAVLMSIGLDGGITPGSMLDSLDLSSDITAKLLRKLLVEGLVASMADKKDRRVKHFYLTDEGYEVVASYLRDCNLPVPDKSEMQIARNTSLNIIGGRK